MLLTTTICHLLPISFPTKPTKCAPGGRYHLLDDVIQGLCCDVTAPVGLPCPTCGDLVVLRARSGEGKAQMMQYWVRTGMIAGPGRGLMQERGPHNWPFSCRLGCAIPRTFPCSKWSVEPRKSGQSTTHSSGLDDSDSTSHSLFLCVFLNVCVPERASRQCMRLSAVCARVCTCTHRDVSTCLPVSICRPISKPEPAEYDNQQGR